MRSKVCCLFTQSNSIIKIFISHFISAGLSKAHFILAEDIRDFYLASDHAEGSLKDLSVRYFAAAEKLSIIETELVCGQILSFCSLHFFSIEILISDRSVVPV